jgi:hypothetical protein
MKLAQIETENVLGVPDGAYSFMRQGTSPADRITLLVGSRGAGKTSLLEAIVFAKECVGGYGPPQRPTSLLRAGAQRGHLRARFLLDGDEQARAELESPDVEISVDLGGEGALPDIPRGARALFAHFSFDESKKKLEYFPDTRSLESSGGPTSIELEKRLRPTRLPLKYAGLVPSLAALSTLDGARALEESGKRGLLLSDDAPDSLGLYRRALARLAPEVHLKGVVPRDATPQLAFAIKGGGVVSVDGLSGAQKQALLFAGTIVRLGLAQSLIFLIDMPELFVHAADHEAFYRGLLAIAPGAQFIIATGSSAVAQCVGRDQTIALGSPR